MTSISTPLLVIHNTHAASCGEPPHLTNADAAAYLGYFAGEHGDQWVFIYDREAHQATLHGGEVQWDKPITITSPRDIPDHFSAGERRWVEACWLAATGLQQEAPRRPS